MAPQQSNRLKAQKRLAHRVPRNLEFGDRFRRPMSIQFSPVQFRIVAAIASVWPAISNENAKAAVRKRGSWPQRQSRRQPGREHQKAGVAPRIETRTADSAPTPSVSHLWPQSDKMCD
jgi:hypothetical protein